MNLRNDIINNWKTDIVGFAHSIDSLENIGYSGWTVKYQDAYGVAIPYEGAEEIHEFFSNAEIRSDIISVKDGLAQRAILLLADYSVAQSSFAALCEELIIPGENGVNRKNVTSSPVTWWQEWKELLGNKNIDERVYDTLGELCVLKHLTSSGVEVSWGGPNAATYDIETPDGYVEVKSTISRSKKEITISSKFQLDPPGKTLDLVMCVFEDSVHNGFSIDQVVTDLGSLGISREYLNTRLSKKGLQEGMSARKRKFILHEMLKYKVDEKFPRITPASFVGGVMPAGITTITYTVNLDGMEAESLIQGDGNDIQNN